ncbi:MAG: glycosyltransferase family 4 protein, partial [Actinobacteria bacterium]|nr:glycosyltransferase family 4 protein [Actinomycetota bacterium]
MSTQEQSLIERFPGRRMPKIAMLVARFPKVTETFQLREMLAFEALGVPLELYAITHHDDGGTVQEEARDLDRRANYFGRISFEMLKAQLVWLRRNREGYLRAWKWSLSAHKTAPEMFVRSFLVVPLAATMALRMERQGIEHVHAHFATYPTQAALIIHWLTGLPFSFTGHAHDIQQRQEGLEAKIDGCEFFVTCTQHSHDALRELYGDKVTEKCHVVHHGINLDAFNYREPPADDGDRPFRMVCVATFEPYKGHHYLIEAVRILRDRGVAVDLKLIGGDPPRKSTLQDEIRAQVR